MNSGHESRDWYVVKIGGELVAPGRLGGIAEAVLAFQEEGVSVAIVHGGGPQASALTRQLGLEPKQVGGRRITDDDVLRVMKQALAGEVSVNLAASLRKEGVKVLAMNGVSGGLVDAVKRPPRRVEGGPDEPVDLGLVGDIVSVDTELLATISRAGYVPAIASLGGDAEGGVWNINADTFAKDVASALGASKLFLVSDVVGVLEDPRDPESRIPRITPALADRLIAEGVITGGMVAKVAEALEGVREGIGTVHVCGSQPGALLGEAHAPGSVGTVFVAA